MHSGNDSIKRQCWELLKDMWWKSPIPESIKEKIFFETKGMVKGKSSGDYSEGTFTDYASQVLENQSLSNSFSIEYPKPPFFKLEKEDPKFIAFYLPQYYPDKHNEAWWGKGSTEWTNVSKSAAQYVGQNQPRFPGELGYYDLRIQDNIYRQIELARIFGVYGFCFYYYWFDGERVLDLPFDNFVNDAKIDFPFMICWCNESWTMQWNGNSSTPLITQSSTKESYKNFIHSCIQLFHKGNYIKIDGRPVITIYKPLNIPAPKEIISYWKDYVFSEIGKVPYLIASIGEEREYNSDYLSWGFDAISEFAPGPQVVSMKRINDQKKFVCGEFYGEVLDYKEFVESKKYFKNNTKKLFRAATPMWDNTPRRKNKGTILDGATPELFNVWITDLIKEINDRKDADAKFIFINAWNEWAEGAYLEPDLKWKYGNLEAIRDAILKSRK